MSDASQLNRQLIDQHLATASLGRHLIYLPTTSSTNDVARQQGRAGAPDGTLVVADEQTSGRGRLSRTWLAPPGSNLLMSLLLRPPLRPAAAFRLIMISATSVAAAIEHTTGLPCGVKWPNDVFIRGRKVAGILSEMTLVDSAIDFVVVGIGLNVNADMSVFDEIAATATSLSAEIGRAVSREELLCQVLLEFENRYTATIEAVGKMRHCAESTLAGGDPRLTETCVADWKDSVYQEWRSRLITLGQWVTVHDGERVEQGLAEDVDASGVLLVRRADGSAIHVAAGDVSLRSPARR